MVPRACLSLRIPLRSHGHPFNGNHQLKTMENHGKPMENHGKPMETNGKPWKTNGNQWKTNGNQWNTNGNQWNTNGNPYPNGKPMKTPPTLRVKPWGPLIHRLPWPMRPVPRSSTGRCCREPRAVLGTTKLPSWGAPLCPGPTYIPESG